jgi:hypothetical protein
MSSSYKVTKYDTKLLNVLHYLLILAFRKLFFCFSCGEDGLKSCSLLQVSNDQFNLQYLFLPSLPQRKWLHLLCQ